MKKLKVVVLLLVAVLLVTGCDLFATKNNETNTKTEEKSKGNCKVTECIKKLDEKSTLEDVNKVMGFEGEVELEGDGYKKYTWKINDDESLSATFYSSSSSITISFKDDLIKNSKVDFSGYEEIQKAMKAGETVTYDQVKAKFKAEGTIIEKSSFGTKYKWVNDKGGYLNATFGNTTGKCTMIIGRI